MVKQFIQEARQAGLPPSAIADRLIRIYGIDADSAKKLVADFFRREKSAKRKRV